MAAPTTGLSWQQMRAYFPHKRLSRYLHPLPDHDLVYVKNPKAGCSTILLWLDRMHTGELDHVFTNMHTQHRLPTVADVGRRKVVRMLSGGAYRFSFVRNPLRRFESAYWDKIVFSENWRSEVQATLGLPLDRSAGLTFEQFLSAAEQQDPIAEMNPHWRPQNVNLMHPLLTFDRLGRLENFQADLEVIREEAGLPQVPYDHRNPSKHRGQESVFDNRPDLVRRVEKLFADDFELYGY
jgi:Sulfotransferase family